MIRFCCVSPRRQTLKALFNTTHNECNHKMKIVSPIALASSSLGAVLLWSGHRRWHRGNSVASLKSDLLSKDQNALQQRSETSPQSWEDVPKPVRRYFHRVFSEENVPFSETDVCVLPAVRSVRSVEFKQKGSMFMNGNWLPFKASQLVSALPSKLGFVWEASCSSGPDGNFSWLWPRIEVVDSWTLGIGRLTAHLFGVVSVVPPPVGQEAEDMLTRGEMQRWLAEAALIPSLLLPEQGVVTWKEIDDDRALIAISDPYNGTDVEFTAVFDKDAWMTKVEGMRYRMVEKDFVLTPWVGYFSNYEFVPDAAVWVPAHMEVGWMLDGKEESYFKGDNFDFKYDLVEPTSSNAGATPME